MQTVSGDESEKKFWRTPELVEGLLPFLDPPSILELAKVHPLTRGIMQGTFTWTTLIRQMCPLPPPFHQTSYSRFEEKSEQKMAEVRPILGILHLVGSPQSHLLSLLCIICERFPADLNSDPYGIMESVNVDCPSHETHQVSALGFVLLEMVEAAQGPSEQKLGSVIVASIKRPLGSALKSRMMRQEGVKMSQVDAHVFTCATQNEAAVLLTLVRRTERFSLRRLDIRGAIGPGGWAALAEALRLLHPLALGPHDPRRFQYLVVGTRNVGPGARNLMLDGRREDVRAVWDALTQGSLLMLLNPMMIFGKVSEEDWVRLELYLDKEEGAGGGNENAEN